MSESVPTAVPETSPASTAGDVIGSLSQDARAHWRMTGELPKNEPAETDDTAADDSPNVTPESLPGEPAAQAAEVAASTPPASKTGTPSKKSNADSRKAELNAEILALKADRDRLRAEFEQLRTSQATPPAVTPESRPDSPPDLAQILSSPNIHEPMLKEDPFWQRYPEASVGDYALYVSRYALRSDAAQRDDLVARQSRINPYFDRLQQRKSEDPSYLDKIDARVKDLVPVDLLPPGARPNAGNIIAQAVVTSPQSLELMEHFSAHPEVLDRLAAFPSAEAIVREVGRIESKLESSKTAPPAAPAALPVSLAPPPPATLGSKPAQPADELAEAIRNGDFVRFRELQNRKEMKSA